MFQILKPCQQSQDCFLKQLRPDSSSRTLHIARTSVKVNKCHCESTGLLYIQPMQLRVWGQPSSPLPQEHLALSSQTSLGPAPPALILFSPQCRISIQYCLISWLNSMSLMILGNREHFPGSSPCGSRCRCLSLAWLVKALQSQGEELRTIKSIIQPTGL